jgi:hypothetical protein
MSESSAHNHGDQPSGSDPQGDFGIQQLPHQLIAAKNASLIIGVVGLVLLLTGLFQPEHFFRSLLFGFHFWLSVSLGCLGFVMISHLTGGAWGAVIRRFGEAGYMNLPLMLVFFLVLTLGYSKLFPWGHMDDFNPALHPGKDLDAAYHVLQHRWPLYNPTVFTLRSLLYFGVWCVLAVLLRTGSIQQDRGPDLVLRRRLRKISAAGMVLFFMTTTGYALDYVSGRETNWYSSILGFITAIGIGLSGMAFMSLMLCYFADKKPIRDVLIPQHTNDLGNICLALVILWMYTNFAQFLIQWNGNMPEDTQYYTQRGLGVIRNSWQYIALFLLLFHFFVPFFLLLMKGLKRNPVTFAGIVGLLFFVRLVDNLWTLAPSGPHRAESSGHIYLTDLFAWAGIGGIWFWNYVRMLADQPLLAKNIANQPEILTYGKPAHA